MWPTGSQAVELKKKWVGVWGYKGKEGNSQEVENVNVW